ncbi:MULTISPECIES: hypothetical protein [unclassified Brucella]|uniref:hypothetical protein n=1 Tax=unclassified Brucella TaxID=2632610 RepID=UPI001FFECFAF|nr:MULTISPECIES: hypothetical protein [unclassified Brucella]
MADPDWTLTVLSLSLRPVPTVFVHGFGKTVSQVVVEPFVEQAAWASTERKDKADALKMERTNAELEDKRADFCTCIHGPFIVTKILAAELS